VAVSQLHLDDAGGLFNYQNFRIGVRLQMVDEGGVQGYGCSTW
jgi:hypothetical protein